MDLIKNKTAPGASRLPIGSAFVEFAFVLPLLIGLLIAIIEFSVALYDKAVLTNAAREGARIGVLKSTDTSSQRAQSVATAVKNYCSQRLITFKAGSSDTPVTVTSLVEPLASGQEGLRVRVSYPYQGFLLGPLFKATMKDPLLLVSEAVMRHEN